MNELLTYQYQQSSTLQKTDKNVNVILSKFSEMDKGNNTCFFWGRLKQPYETAKCLITLSNIVQSSFNLSPFQLGLLKDPIVTAGNNCIRFEGFSHCAGVYGRVDVTGSGLDGEFLEAGTTNVDFNPPLIGALGKVQTKDKLVFSVGRKEVGFYQDGERYIERKVPLPTKWIKGLATIQYFLANAKKVVYRTRKYD